MQSNEPGEEPSLPPLPFDLTPSQSTFMLPSRGFLPAYPSGSALAVWVIGFLTAGVLQHALTCWVCYQLYQAVSSDDGSVHAEAIFSSGVHLQAVGVVALLCYLISAILILVWLYRAHRYLQSLGAQGLQFTPGWVVGYFFIPILNLFRPYQGVREIWQASDPGDPDGVSWQKTAAPALLPTWWGVYLLSGFLGGVAGMSDRFYAGLASSVTERLAIQARMLLLSNLASILASLLAIAVVRGVTIRQEQKSRNMGFLRNGPALSRGRLALAIGVVSVICLGMFLLFSAGLAASERPSSAETAAIPSPSAPADTSSSAYSPPGGGQEETSDASADWIDFSPDNGHLHVLMPDQPKEQIQQQDSPTGPITTHIYAASDGIVAYVVSYSDTSGPIDDSSKEGYLVGACQGMVNSAHGAFLRNTSEIWQGHPLREIEYSGEQNLHGNAKVFLDGQRLYIVAAIYSTDKTTANNPEVQHFLSSMRLNP